MWVAREAAVKGSPDVPWTCQGCRRLGARHACKDILTERTNGLEYMVPEFRIPSATANASYVSRASAIQSAWIALTFFA